MKVLDDIEAKTKTVAELWRWMYPIAYERSVKGEGGRGGGVPRPVEAIGASKSYVRSQVRLAERLVLRAAAEMLGAKAALERAANDQDEETPEHTPDEFHDSGPSMVTKGELELAKRARDRRAKRGEGHGAA